MNVNACMGERVGMCGRSRDRRRGEPMQADNGKHAQVGNRE